MFSNPDSEVDRMPAPYERPELKDLGSLQALTAQDKDFTGNDGLTLQGVIIGNSS